MSLSMFADFGNLFEASEPLRACFMTSVLFEASEPLGL